MTNQRQENKHCGHSQPSNFLFGFLIGTTCVIAGGYLFGTKQGRDLLIKMVQFSENLESNIENYIHKKNRLVLDKNSKPFIHVNVEGILDRIQKVAVSNRTKK